MIKTLRITSVLAAILAIAFVGISVVYGIGNDPEVNQLLKAPSAVERFEKNQGRNARKAGTDTKSPLVDAAEQLAKLINPPQRIVRRPPGRSSKIPRRSTPKVAPQKTSAKFKVLGTCFSSVPADRCAFIDEPGQGQHWVREGDEIGHLTIKEIKDGVIVVHNGQGLEEIPVEATKVVNLIDDGTGPAADPGGDTQGVSGRPTSGSTVLKPPVRRPGQSVASYQAALRAYRASQARSAAIKAVPGADSEKPSPGGAGEGISKPEIVRRPLTTDQDVKEFEDIVNTLRNLKDDPTAVNKTPEQIEADKRVREELIKRMTAQMRQGRLRGNKSPSLGNRSVELGDLRSGGKTD